MRAVDVKHRKQALAKRTMLIVCIGVPVLAIAGWLGSGSIRRHTQAKHNVDALLSAIQTYVSEQGELPKGSYATICKLLRGESVDGQNPKHLDYIDAEGQEMNSKGEFLDPWGRPYRIRFDRKLRVYSCGPSGLDEDGKGDNIVAQ